MRLPMSNQNTLSLLTVFKITLQIYVVHEGMEAIMANKPSYSVRIGGTSARVIEE